MKILDTTELYLRERSLANDTKRHFRFVSDLFVRDTKVTEIEDVTIDTICVWREIVIGRNARPTTWNNYLLHMKIITNYAVRNNFREYLPNLNKLHMKCHNDKPKTIKIRKLREIINYLSGEQVSFRPNWFWVALIRVLFYTGMRRRQIAGLRWRDIHFEEKTIELASGTSKTRKSWEIPALENVLTELNIIRKHTLEVVPLDSEFENRYVFDISLFHSRFKCNGRLAESAISNFFSRLSRKTGTKISAHLLRHTIATRLARMGRYKDLQILLGHASISSTIIYVHPPLDSVRQLMTSLKNTEV